MKKEANMLRIALRAMLLTAMLSALSAGARADDSLKIAIGQRGGWEQSVCDLGQAKGFFKKHGLTLETLYTQGSAETLQSVISNSVDIGIGLGDGCDELARVGMERTDEQLVSRGVLDDTTAQHDEDPVGHVMHDTANLVSSVAGDVVRRDVAEHDALQRDTSRRVALCRGARCCRVGDNSEGPEGGHHLDHEREGERQTEEQGGGRQRDEDAQGDNAAR